MASPQKEDGHVEIANEIIEILAMTYLSSYESQVLWAIFRKTYGWQKKEDWITNTQLSRMTNIKECHISRTMKKLIKRNMVIKNGKKISFQKDYDKWEKIPIQVTNKNIPKQDKKIPIQVTKDTHSGIKKIPIQVDTKETKETTTKETIQKKENTFLLIKEIVDYLNKKTNKHFKPTTESTKRLIKARLKEENEIDAFKWVIDAKCEDWLNNPKFDKFLRPETLFGNKFEGYLMEKEFIEKEGESE